MVCEVCSRDYSEDGAPITDYQRWLAAPEQCPNCGGVQRASTSLASQDLDRYCDTPGDVPASNPSFLCDQFVTYEHQEMGPGFAGV